MILLDTSTLSGTVTVASGDVVTLALCPAADGQYPPGAKATVYWQTDGGARGPVVGSLSPGGPEAVGVLDAPGTYLVERTPGAYTVERN